MSSEQVSYSFKNKKYSYESNGAHARVLPHTYICQAMCVAMLVCNVAEVGSGEGRHQVLEEVTSYSKYKNL